MPPGKAMASAAKESEKSYSAIRAFEEGQSQAINRIDEQGRRLDRLESRSNDIFDAISVESSRFGIITALFGVLITSVVIFFTIRTSDSAVKDARNEVRVQMESWLGQYKDDFDGMLIEGRRIAQEIKGAEADARVHLDQIMATHTEVDSESERIKALIIRVGRQSETSSDVRDAKLDSSEREALATAARDAASQPMPNFQDLYIQGLAAHELGNYSSAIKFFSRAEDAAPDLASRARVQNSMALSHARGGNNAEAVQIWSRVETDYLRAAKEEPQLAVEVVKALANIAVYHNRDREFDSTLSVCDKAVMAFGDSEYPTLQRQFSRIYLSKAMALRASGLKKLALQMFETSRSLLYLSGLGEVEEKARVEFNIIMTNMQIGNLNESNRLVMEFVNTYETASSNEIKTMVEAARKVQNVEVAKEP